MGQVVGKLIDGMVDADTYSLTGIQHLSSGVYMQRKVMDSSNTKNNYLSK